MEPILGSVFKKYIFILVASNAINREISCETQ